MGSRRLGVNTYAAGGTSGDQRGCTLQRRSSDLEQRLLLRLQAASRGINEALAGHWKVAGRLGTVAFPFPGGPGRELCTLRITRDNQYGVVGFGLRCPRTPILADNHARQINLR